MDCRFNELFSLLCSHRMGWRCEAHFWRSSHGHCQPPIHGWCLHTHDVPAGQRHGKHRKDFFCWQIYKLGVKSRISVWRLSFCSCRIRSVLVVTYAWCHQTLAYKSDNLVNIFIAKMGAAVLFEACSVFALVLCGSTPELPCCAAQTWHDPPQQLHPWPSLSS